MCNVNLNWDVGVVKALSGRCFEHGRRTDLHHSWAGLPATERP
jgi:hypothetical protein